MNDFEKGLAIGKQQIIQSIKELLENSENRVSIISILALLDRHEAELEKLGLSSKEKENV